MKIVLSAEGDQWEKATTEYERIMAKGATQAFRKLSRVVELAARRAVGAAGFTSNVQRTIQALNKPPSGYVLNPRIWLHSTVNYLDVFESGRTITGGGVTSSEFLWLPLPNVPPNVGSGVRFGGLISRPHMTPSQYIRKVGRLVFMKNARGPGLPMLGAIIKKRVSAKGRPSLRTLRKTAATTRFFKQDKVETEIIPMFYAIRKVSIPPKFDTSKAADDAMDGLGIIYNEVVEPYEGQPSGD